MRKEYHLAMRRQAILNTLDKAGEVSVAELSEQFHVSEVTIRQDLQALSRQNLLLRTRGGAITPAAQAELSFEVREQQQAEKKARIARAAAKLVQPGDSIAIDASTTAQALIPLLRGVPELTIITNSLRAAINLLRAPQIHVIVPGGSLRRDSVSLVSLREDEFFKGLNARVGFFGARGITPEQGLTDINLEEAHTKHKMVEICQRVVGVLDGSKWGQMAVVTFASLNEVDCIITDDSAPVDLVSIVKSRGVDVTVV